MLAEPHVDSGARACSKCVSCTEMPCGERTAASFCLLPNHQTAVEPLRLHRGGIVCCAAARDLSGPRLPNALPHETGSGAFVADTVNLKGDIALYSTLRGRPWRLDAKWTAGWMDGYIDFAVRYLG